MVFPWQLKIDQKSEGFVNGNTFLRKTFENIEFVTTEDRWNIVSRKFFCYRWVMDTILISVNLVDFLFNSYSKEVVNFQIIVSLCLLVIPLYIPLHLASANIQVRSDKQSRCICDAKHFFFNTAKSKNKKQKSISIHHRKMWIRLEMMKFPWTRYHHQNGFFVMKTCCQHGPKEFPFSICPISSLYNFFAITLTLHFRNQIFNNWNNVILWALNCIITSNILWMSSNITTHLIKIKRKILWNCRRETASKITKTELLESQC